MSNELRSIRTYFLLLSKRHRYIHLNSSCIYYIRWTTLCWKTHCWMDSCFVQRIDRHFEEMLTKFNWLMASIDLTYYPSINCPSVKSHSAKSISTISARRILFQTKSTSSWNKFYRQSSFQINTISFFK